MDDIEISPRLAAVIALLLTTACAADEPASETSLPVEEATTEEATTEEATTEEETASDDASRTVEQLRDVPFRVLLLPERFADGAVITSGPVWYAMAHHDERNINVAIHATNNVHMDLGDDVELPPPNARVRGLPAHTNLNEGIRAVTWVEDEVSYVVEIECWDVLQDQRCTEPGFAVEVAEGLVEAPR